MRLCVLMLVCALPISGCVARIPSNVEAGSAGQSRFDADRARREAALNGSNLRTSPGIVTPNAARNLPLPGQPAPAPATTGTPPVIASSDLQNAGIGTRPVAQAPTPVAATPQQVPSVPTNQAPTADVGIASTGISNEQDFDAVSDTRDIEDDAELRARQQAAYQVIQPEALPERGNAGPNIIEYAINAPNRRGQEWYSRSILSGQGRFERNCASYRSADEAQRDFLTRGGPERDPRGIDPDGDGFACGWDPAPFRAAAGN